MLAWVCWISGELAPESRIEATSTAVRRRAMPPISQFSGNLSGIFFMNLPITASFPLEPRDKIV